MLSSSSSLNSSLSEVPPPLATPSPPSPLSPTQSPPNAGSDPPMPSNSSDPSPPPKSPPSTPSAAPPVGVSPPPPLLSSLPPALSPPPPSLPSSPPASPPAPSIHSVPPVSAPPPSARNSPPISASPPPPVPIVSPPSSSPPPLDSPVLPSPPSPPSSVTSPSPPLAEPPKSSPHAPKIPSLAPSGSKLAPPPFPISHPKPSSPTPTNHAQPISPSSPGNSSILATPSTPPLSSSTPTGNLSPPISPKPSNSSNSYADVNIGSGTLASPGARSDGIKTGNAVVIAIAVGLVLLLFVLALWWCVKKKNKRVTGFNGGYVIPTPLGSSQRSDTSYSKPPSWAPLLRNVSSSSGLLYSPRQSSGLGNSRSWFTYEELLEVTNGFSKQNLLGEGGFGSVYKGRLPDGREVAVKQLKVGGSQGEREFRAEVEIIGRVHHRHLVSLVGYCISEHQRLLVYDYVPNNTLDYHLHGEGKPVMDWAARLHVAVGAARGIAYLHEDCHPRIIHRDIKSSNILLDNNFEAQVSDFGLAKLALDSFTHVSTRVMGTFGYVAPEYASSGKLTEKSDVYSFGVVLLELITGRKPVDTSQPMGDESLVEWARPLLSQALENGVFEGLVDSRLERDYLESEMFSMIEVAAACVRHSAMRRPRMGQVVRVLECTDESDLNNGMKPGQSKLIDSAAQPVDIRMLQRIAFGSQEYSDDSRESRWRPERNL